MSFKDSTTALDYLTRYYHGKTPTPEQLHDCAQGGKADDVSSMAQNAAIIVLEEQVSPMANITGEEFVHYDISNGPICVAQMPAWYIEEQKLAEARRAEKLAARAKKAAAPEATR